MCDSARKLRIEFSFVLKKCSISAIIDKKINHNFNSLLKNPNLVLIFGFLLENSDWGLESTKKHIYYVNLDIMPGFSTFEELFNSKNVTLYNI